jgi:hypothetical protein
VWEYFMGQGYRKACGWLRSAPVGQAPRVIHRVGATHSVPRMNLIF